ADTLLEECPIVASVCEQRSITCLPCLWSLHRPIRGESPCGIPFCGLSADRSAARTMPCYGPTTTTSRIKALFAHLPGCRVCIALIEERRAGSPALLSEISRPRTHPQRSGRGRP